MADEDMDRRSPVDEDDGGLIGSSALRPVFLGNLVNNYTAQDVKEALDTSCLPHALEETSLCQFH